MKQIYIISEESFVSELFIGSVSILNVLASPIILSMCTRLLDIFLSSITVAQDILFFFLKNVGVFIWIFLCTNISCTLKPLSAIIESPELHISNSLLRSTIWRSLVEPPYAVDIYDVNPPGVAPTRTFTVFLFL